MKNFLTCFVATVLSLHAGTAFAAEYRDTHQSNDASAKESIDEEDCGCEQASDGGEDNEGTE